MITEILLLFLVLVISWDYWKKRVSRFPPGPIGLPLLGHLPFLGKYPFKTLGDWTKTYGPIIGVWFGSYRTVVINDAKLIREAMNLNVFAGRPLLNVFTVISEDKIIRGMVSTDGSHWTEQRRFAMKQLRNLGFGTKTMEARIQEAINDFLDRLKLKEGKPIEVKNLFSAPVISALWSILFGDKLKEDDPDLWEAFHGLNSVADASISVFLPWLAKIAPKLCKFDQVIQGFSSMKRFLRKEIQSHNAHYVEDQPRDFLDAYTDEVLKTTDPNSSFHKSKDVMVHIILDLFAAGTETTSTTLVWLCAYLLHDEHVQNKLQEEIDGVVGRERVPSLVDRVSMPYTEAVINEVLRFSSLLPFALIHRAMEDVEFHGLFIPKDTMIIANLHAVHYDEMIWGDPENFRPERFIDSNGKIKKNENQMPFSTGKRICLGEGLARDELFLFTVSLFQRFRLSGVGGLPSLEPHMGFTLSPQTFEIILKTRDE